MTQTRKSHSTTLLKDTARNDRFKIDERRIALFFLQESKGNIPSIHVNAAVIQRYNKNRFIEAFLKYLASKDHPFGLSLEDNIFSPVEWQSIMPVVLAHSFLRKLKINKAFVANHFQIFLQLLADNRSLCEFEFGNGFFYSDAVNLTDAIGEKTTITHIIVGEMEKHPGWRSGTYPENYIIAGFPNLQSITTLDAEQRIEIQALENNDHLVDINQINGSGHTISIRRTILEFMLGSMLNCNRSIQNAAKKMRKNLPFLLLIAATRATQGSAEYKILDRKNALMWLSRDIQKLIGDEPICEEKGYIGPASTIKKFHSIVPACFQRVFDMPIKQNAKGRNYIEIKAPKEMLRIFYGAIISSLHTYLKIDIFAIGQLDNGENPTTFTVKSPKAMYAVFRARRRSASNWYLDFFVDPYNRWIAKRIKIYLASLRHYHLHLNPDLFFTQIQQRDLPNFPKSSHCCSHCALLALETQIHAEVGQELLDYQQNVPVLYPEDIKAAVTPFPEFKWLYSAIDEEKTPIDRLVKTCLALFGSLSTFPKIPAEFGSLSTLQKIPAECGLGKIVKQLSPMQAILTMTDKYRIGVILDKKFVVTIFKYRQHIAAFIEYLTIVVGNLKNPHEIQNAYETAFNQIHVGWFLEGPRNLSNFSIQTIIDDFIATNKIPSQFLSDDARKGLKKYHHSLSTFAQAYKKCKAQIRCSRDVTRLFTDLRLAEDIVRGHSYRVDPVPRFLSVADDKKQEAMVSPKAPKTSSLFSSLATILQYVTGPSPSSAAQRAANPRPF